MQWNLGWLPVHSSRSKGLKSFYPWRGISIAWRRKCKRDDQKEQRERTIRKVMVGVGKNEKQKFEQEKMSPCKVKPKQKKSMHYKVSSLCVPHKKSKADYGGG